jgi:hypothetical protein
MQPAFFFWQCDAIERYLAEAMLPYDDSELRVFHRSHFGAAAARPLPPPTRAEKGQTNTLLRRQANSRRLPRLSVMAAGFWAAPATRAPSEEVFFCRQ